MVARCAALRDAALSAHGRPASSAGGCIPAEREVVLPAPVGEEEGAGAVPARRRPRARLYVFCDPAAEAREEHTLCRCQDPLRRYVAEPTTPLACLVPLPWGTPAVSAPPAGCALAPVACGTPRSPLCRGGPPVYRARGSGCTAGGAGGLRRQAPGLRSAAARRNPANRSAGAAPRLATPCRLALAAVAAPWGARAVPQRPPAPPDAALSAPKCMLQHKREGSRCAGAASRVRACACACACFPASARYPAPAAQALAPVPARLLSRRCRDWLRLQWSAEAGCQ
jgi:hypothetical protein